MKKTKVENVSSIKLDFFLKQDKQDVRVILMPGESSWCDHGSLTRSMILYERKNLIKSIAQVETATEDIEAIKEDYAKEVTTAEIVSPLDKAQKETEAYKQESEKKYKGKKRGRKKKRGPKPGSKRNKGQNPGTPETPVQ